MSSGGYLSVRGQARVTLGVVLVLLAAVAWMAFHPVSTQDVGQEGTQCIVRHTEHMPRNNPTHQYWVPRST